MLLPRNFELFVDRREIIKFVCNLGGPGKRRCILEHVRQILLFVSGYSQMWSPKGRDGRPAVATRGAVAEKASQRVLV